MDCDILSSINNFINKKKDKFMNSISKKSKMNYNIEIFDQIQSIDTTVESRKIDSKLYNHPQKLNSKCFYSKICPNLIFFLTKFSVISFILENILKSFS